MKLYENRHNLYFGIFLIFLFGIYLKTICPVVYLGDSGELTAAAYSLGISHNSGYPLYCIIGKIFCLIPICNIGFRMNLMSTFFCLLTVFMTYKIIFKFTSSFISSFFGASILGSLPIFWFQSVSAEVYPLHTFFVAFLILMLLWWEEKREGHILVLFFFILGLSFCNHLQTLMLLPSILFFVLYIEKRYLFESKKLILISIFFILSLTIYLYLPIRTKAGAAIHWGDPDTFKRFLRHVTATSHREGYVFNKSFQEYVSRVKDVSILILEQFKISFIFAVFGILYLIRKRGYWMLSFLLIIIFDFFYTIFLNTISLKVTPFNLPTCIIISILTGIGLNLILTFLIKQLNIKIKLQPLLYYLILFISILLFLFNFSNIDQSRNYTAYEHAINIFRSIDNNGVVFLDGDNNIFPVIYGRIVEGMREDVRIYDRYNIIFKTPYLGPKKRYIHGEWEDIQSLLEKYIIEKTNGNHIYYAVFNPNDISLPNKCFLLPYGIVNKVVKKEDIIVIVKDINRIWSYYYKESFYEDFNRDFMHRQVCAYFYFSLAKFFFIIHQDPIAIKDLKIASTIGYDDESIHSEIAVLLIEKGYFNLAYRELEKALIYYDDLSGVYNNWGYYYYKIGRYEAAVSYFKKAIKLKDKNVMYYNNLSLALLKLGKFKEALKYLKTSLKIKRNQPGILKLIKEYNLELDQSIIQKR